MNHPTHKLKAYTGEPHKPLVFCEHCGKEEGEGLSEPCDKKYAAKWELMAEERIDKNNQTS